MQHIILFFIKNKYFLLFLFLEIIAISFTINSHSYHRSKLINSSNFITGSIYNTFNQFNDYTHLKTYNNQLLEENTKLKNLLSDSNSKESSKDFKRSDSLRYNHVFHYIKGRIIKNEFHKINNRLTINKGLIDGVKPELAVVSSKGIIGITTDVSDNYAIVMPIINEKTRINVKLKNSHHFGTLTWNGKNYNTVQLEDLPRQADIKKGDTIITGGKSTIFPEGIKVGIIDNYKTTNNNYEIINIKLFNDMSAIYHINIITNIDKDEIKQLENE